MKNIFIPTDFSDCANDAVEAGLMFAKRFNSTLHLYHWLALPFGWDKMGKEEQNNFPQMQHFIKNIEASFEKIVNAHPDISITYAISSENFTKSIKNYVKEHHIDLIIMGSHGTSGKNEYFIGSNAQRVVRQVPCSVLVLKSPLQNLDFKKVIFASSFNTHEKKAFAAFRNFVKPYLPEIHLLAIQVAALFSPPIIVFEQAMEAFKELCPPLHCEIHTIRDYSVDQGVREFSLQLGANLIGISKHEHHPLKRLIMGSNVEFLVNHSDLPVLCVDYEE